MIRITKHSLYAVLAHGTYQYYGVLTKQILFGGNLAIIWPLTSTTLLSAPEVLKLRYRRRDIKIVDFYFANKAKRVVKIGTLPSDFHPLTNIVYHNKTTRLVSVKDGKKIHCNEPVFEKKVGHYFIFSPENLTTENRTVTNLSQLESKDYIMTDLTCHVVP